MNKDEFLKEVSNLMEKFYNEVHAPLVKVVNEYKENEDSKTYYDLCYEQCIKRLDDMALLTAWVIDHLDNKEGFVGSRTYNKSLTKKIRKALGFNM